MKKLNICVDIDGTMTEPFYWLKAANAWFKTNVQPEDVKEYDIHHVLGIKRRDYLDFYNTMGEALHLNALPRPNASSVLHRLAQHHNIYYVTAREARMENVSKQWFEENGMPEAPLFLLGSHHKSEMAKQLKCDLFIEDRYENALELVMSGTPVLLMDCTYNRFHTILNIERIFDWNEAERKINLFAKAHAQAFKIA